MNARVQRKAPAAKTASAEALDVLRRWAAGLCDARSLLDANLHTWVGGLRDSGSVKAEPDGEDIFFRVELEKPRGEGVTHRYFDPEGLALLMALCIPGGRLVIEPQGPDNDVYYLRLYIGKARSNVLAIIADTATGDRAREGEYHSLRRRDIGRRASGTGEKVSQGADMAFRDASEAFRQVVAENPDAYPADFTEGAYTGLLHACRDRLKALPLAGDASRAEPEGNQ